MGKYAIGIDVGGTQIRMGIFDADMQLVAQQKYLTDADSTAAELMDFLAQQTKQLVEKTGLKPQDVRGAGAAFPASVDTGRGVTLESGNVVCLVDQPVRDMLEQRLQMPVFVDNDGNLAALARAGDTTT